MRRLITRRHTFLALAAVTLAACPIADLAGQEAFRFRTGVELINVTATVVDRAGRFVPGLRQADFTVYDDDRQVDVTLFSAERVPVSLGICAGYQRQHGRGQARERARGDRAVPRSTDHGRR